MANQVVALVFEGQWTAEGMLDNFLGWQEQGIVDLEDVMFLSSQIPDCQLRIIKNVGHFLHVENETVFGIYRELLSNGTQYARTNLINMRYKYGCNT